MVNDAKQAALQKKLDNEVAQKEAGAQAVGPAPVANTAVDSAEQQVAQGPQQSAGTPSALEQTATFKLPGKTGMEEQVVSLIEDGKDINKQLTEDARRTKEILWKEPLVRFVCPLDIGDVPGVAREFVSINGYNMYIKKGVMIDLPTSVVHRLMEYYNINAGNVGLDKRIDRSDTVRQALNR